MMILRSKEAEFQGFPAKASFERREGRPGDHSFTRGDIYILPNVCHINVFCS